MKRTSGRVSLAVMGLAAVLTALSAGFVLAMGVGVHVLSAGGAKPPDPATGGGGTGSGGEVRTIPPSRLTPTAESKPATDTVPPPEPAGLLPELSRLVDREGTIVRKAVGPEGGMRTVFRSADEKIEMVLLENRYLETLENLTEYGKTSVRVRISGTIYVYRNANYLLLTLVQVKQP